MKLFRKTSLQFQAQEPKMLRSLVASLITTSSLLAQYGVNTPTQVQAQQVSDICRFSSQAINQKENLRQNYLGGNSDAANRYKALVEKHGELLEMCRSRNWPQRQAIWLRLHPCDANPGALEKVLDQIVNLGYNEVYIEAFGNSQVLLPAAENDTPWISVVRTPGQENVDLLAEVIAKGRARGLKVYAWMFTMNFGYGYGQKPQNQATLARDGEGNTSLALGGVHNEAFVDPYNRQAQLQYVNLLRQVIKRKPDGVLFDYIRYPRRSGSQSVATKVKDLWVYGQASRQALNRRAFNSKGQFLIDRYLDQGYLKLVDFQEMQRLYADEGGPPLWQGRTPAPQEMSLMVVPEGETEMPSIESIYTESLRQRIQDELWDLTVAHAAQGVVDFVSLVSRTVESDGIRAGAVFFPDGNRAIGQKGYDSRLQPWDRFPKSLEWHPMSYAVCGTPDCIIEQVDRVMQLAPNNAQVMPVLAGVWRQPHTNRPPLELQMQALQAAFPEIKQVSHFAFSWQEPGLTAARKRCDI